MAIGVSPQTSYEQSYVTVAEYKNAPTSIDYDNLVVGGNASAQDAELALVLLRASSTLDEYFNQSLYATNQVETQRVRVTPQGWISLHPKNWPVISLSDFQYGTDPNNLQVYPDCSKVYFESQQIIVPLYSLSTSYSSQGPLSFGVSPGPRNQIFTKTTYVSGYVCSTILSATAGATSLTVNNPVGITAGAQLYIANGASNEVVYVATSYVYGSTTVPLLSALAYSHVNGVAIGNVPNAIKQATIRLTTLFLRLRGDSSMSMNITTQPSGSGSSTGGEMAGILDSVNTYRRIR